MGVKVRFRRGAWWVIVDHNRMRKAKRIGSKAAAELIAAKIQVALAEGRAPFPEAPVESPQPALVSFRETAERWLATYPAPRRPPAEHGRRVSPGAEAPRVSPPRGQAVHRHHAR